MAKRPTKPADDADIDLDAEIELEMEAGDPEEEEDERPVLSRARDTRDNARRVETYIPPPLLPYPDPEPGVVFKWIRKSTHGHIDARNMARRAQQGFTLCRQQDYPEIASIIDPFKNIEGAGDYIESGGLVLAKLDQTTAQGIRDYNTRRARAQLRAVDNTYFSLKDRGVEVFRDPESKVTKSNRGS